MREIVFMWIAAIVSGAMGYLAGRGFRRNDEPLEPRIPSDDEIDYAKQNLPNFPRKVPGAGSEPEEIPAAQVARMPPKPSVLETMTDWDAAREDEQRQDSRFFGDVRQVLRGWKNSPGLEEAIDREFASRLPPADEAKIIGELWPSTGLPD